MEIKILEELVENKTIDSYVLNDINEDGKIIIDPTDEGDFRNTQELIINFINGNSIKISTFCSGSSENSSLDINNNGQ